MAKADFKLPEEFLSKISKLEERTDEIVPKVLQAGAEVVLGAVQSSLVAVIGKNTKSESRSTGQLAQALGVSPAKMDKDNNYNVKVGFAENRPDGKTNAMLANIIEYGKSGQPPKPFLKSAKLSSKVTCVEAMKAKLESEIDGI